ncbi:MAG: NADH-quinone oxidoreductase subunit A [Deltaproteobacteria bacterium]|nr:NADH-quinone oxidoreductase subunit A [Deltaproteobacteria bacterium]
MPDSYSLFFFIALVVFSGAAIIVISYFLGKRPLTAAKTIPYECGMDPIDKPNTIFSIKFYVVALIFVIFDVETVFIYLWAIVVEKMGIFGLIEMLVFIGILLIAFFYAWRKGGLKWE